jgi:uncharacterized membrane protein YczE
VNAHDERLVAARLVICMVIGVALAFILHWTMPNSTFFQRMRVCLIACAVMAAGFVVQDYWPYIKAEYLIK